MSSTILLSQKKNTPLTVQFKSFGHDAGHYDCVTTAHVNTTTKTQTAVSNEAVRSLLETISPKPKASKPWSLLVC